MIFEGKNENKLVNIAKTMQLILFLFKRYKQQWRFM
jgi:hypothetical protein